MLFLNKIGNLLLLELTYNKDKFFKKNSLKNTLIIKSVILYYLTITKKLSIIKVIKEMINLKNI